MTFNQSFVLEKMTQINGYLKEIEDFFRFSDAEILSDSGKLRIAERLLQLVVDAILDINQHFVKELNLNAAEDFQSTFYILGGAGVLPKDFANKIAPVVAVRNRIVHGYEKLNQELFIKTFRKEYRDFEKYLKFIQVYLEKNP